MIDFKSKAYSGFKIGIKTQGVLYLYLLSILQKVSLFAYLTLIKASTSISSFNSMTKTEIRDIKLRQDYEELTYFIRRPAVVQALQKKGIEYFFPIQYETFDAIKFGCDLIGRDKTGSGKTIAYALPILQRLRNQRLLCQPQPLPKYLIILPTRELTIQVTNQIESLKVRPDEYRILSVYGGAPIGDQIAKLRRGVDIIAATPGRLIDLLNRGEIRLQEIQTVCLDEADQMLKQGFQQDVDQIFKFISKATSHNTQKLLFSATIPKWVEKLASTYMTKSRVSVDLIKNYEIKTPNTIEHLCITNSRDRRVLNENIKNLITIYAGSSGSVIIFCETKREANEFHSSLNLVQRKSLLHGDIPQIQREYTFKDFKAGKIKCLIATNVAARGLDIPSVDLIIQLEPPKKVDDYVHRAGRTGRAGKKGICITFFDHRERYLMNQIEKLACIRFIEIPAPRPVDILKASSKEIIDNIKSMDQGLCDYFEEAAKELIADLGSQKALALAIAHISGIKARPQQYSMQTKAAGFMTYLFKTEGQNLQSKELKQFLSCHLQRFSQEDLYNINHLSQRTIVFDMKEVFKKQMQRLIVNFEKKQNFLEKVYRIKAVYDEDALKNFEEDDEMNFTADEYEDAIRNKRQWEVVVRGLGNNTTDDSLFKFFKNNGIRIVQVNLLKNQQGATGIAFVLCINLEQKHKAIQLGKRGMTLQNRAIVIEEPKKNK